MTDGVEIDIRGLAETQRSIYEFSEKLGDRVTLLALRAGANYMLKQVRAAEPVKTGRMKRATVVQTSKINRRRRNGKVGVYITIKKGRSRDDSKGAYYANWVENGFNRGSKQITARQAISSGIVSDAEHVRRFSALNANRRGLTVKRVVYRAGGISVPGQHFMRDTYERTKLETLNRILADIDEGGRKLAHEIESRG
jgi:hypothetical protein